MLTHEHHAESFQLQLHVRSHASAAFKVKKRSVNHFHVCEKHVRRMYGDTAEALFADLTCLGLMLKNMLETMDKAPYCYFGLFESI